MAEFLSRWDDESRPSFTDALKDLGLRAVLPAFVLFGVIVGFGFLLLGPWYQFADSENGVNRWFQDRRTEAWNSVTHVMSTIGNTEYVIGVGVVVCAIIWWRTRRWWYAAVPMIAISLQATVFVIAANIVGRDRPNVERLDPTPPTSSYPSGHVGAATALYVSFALLAQSIERAALRRLVTALFLVIPVLVAWARLYRGMHHLSDILIGALNGLVCALLAWAYLRRKAYSGQY